MLLKEFPYSSDDVSRELKSLQSRKSPQPNDLSPKIIKTFSGQFTTPLNSTQLNSTQLKHYTFPYRVANFPRFMETAKNLSSTQDEKLVPAWKLSVNWFIHFIFL